MQITIYGSGAIGGTVGAYLTQAGLETTLVDRDLGHVASMRARGLTIQLGETSITTAVNAISPAELSGPLELVLLAVKAQHTAEAMAVIAPLLEPSSCVVSLQNGLCERVIAECVGPDRTIGCLVNFSADYLEPGVIAYGAAGTLELGELDGRSTPRLLEIRDILGHAGEVTVTDNIWGYLWGKMGYANMLYATALTDETMADILDRYRPLMVELAVEIYEVADQEGVIPEAFDDVEPALYHPRDQQDWDAINRSLDALVARRRRDAKSRSGIWRDLAIRKRRTEVDEQIGLAAAIGADHGLNMPLTRQLVTMIHELEDGTRRRSLSNLEELAGLHAASSRPAE
jgi:2-dehydropantoate 2-reductase